MFWKIGFTICGLLSFGDAVIAIHSWDHMGDMHAAWAGDAIVAGAAWIYTGWKVF